MTDRPEDKQQTQSRRRARSQGLAYQGAFEAVVAVLIATGIGYWIDETWEVSPWGLLIGTALGFASFVHRLLRLGKQLQELGALDVPEDESERK